MGDVVETTAQSEGKEVAAREESTRELERYATPPVDIYETGDGLVVMADLPGVKAEGLSVRVEEGVLTIEGRHSHEKEDIYLEREFELASFYRQFRLADTVDTGKIKAALKHGVLTLTLPKSEKAKPRQISIET